MAKVTVKVATMGVGKTAEACIMAFRDDEKNKDSLCISPSIDTRFGEATVDSLGYKKGKWQSRIKGLERDVFLVEEKGSITELLNNIERDYGKNVEIMRIDEAQFLSIDQVEELFKLAIYRKINIICYALLTNFKTELFEGTKRFIELGANLIFFDAEERDIDKPVVNARIINNEIVKDGEEVFIGGNESYKALSLKDYWENNLNLEKNNEIQAKYSESKFEEVEENGHINVNKDEITIEEMDFSVRAYNCLKRYGINFLGELISLSDEKLLKIKNMGKRTLQEIKDKVKEYE